MPAVHRSGQDRKEDLWEDDLGILGVGLVLPFQFLHHDFLPSLPGVRDDPGELFQEGMKVQGLPSLKGKHGLRTIR